MQPLGQLCLVSRYELFSTCVYMLLQFSEYCELKYEIDRLKRDLTSKCGEEHRKLIN